MKLAEELRVLANAHEENGEYDLARQLYRRALNARVRTAGNASPLLVPYIYDLAFICAAMDDEREARNLFAWLLRLAPHDAGLLSEVECALGEIQAAPSAA